jgi:hypothetical protein
LLQACQRKKIRLILVATHLDAVSDHTKSQSFLTSLTRQPAMVPFFGEPLLLSSRPDSPTIKELQLRIRKAAQELLVDLNRGAIVAAECEQILSDHDLASIMLASELEEITGLLADSYVQQYMHDVGAIFKSANWVFANAALLAQLIQFLDIPDHRPSMRNDRQRQTSRLVPRDLALKSLENLLLKANCTVLGR